MARKPEGEIKYPPIKDTHQREKSELARLKARLAIFRAIQSTSSTNFEQIFTQFYQPETASIIPFSSIQWIEKNYPNEDQDSYMQQELHHIFELDIKAARVSAAPFDLRGNAIPLDQLIGQAEKRIAELEARQTLEKSSI